MSGLLGVFGGLADGYVKGTQIRRDMERDDEDRAYMRDQRERTKRLQGEEDAYRVSMRDAAKPAAVEPVDIPAEGPVEPGAAPPMKQGYMVNGSVVGNEIERDKAVSAYDAPEARTARMADAYTSNGKPVEAMQLRTGMRQEKLGDLQLGEAQLKALDTAYERDLKARGATFDGLGTFISETVGDGQGGALKGKFVPAADGKKVTFNSIAPDGSMVPTSYSFNNDAEGLWTAQSTLSRLTTADQKLAHLYEQRKSVNASRKLDEDERHNKAMEGNSAERIAMMQTVADIRASKAGGGSGSLTMADLRDGHKSIASTLNSDYKTQIESEPDPAKGKAIKTARESEIDSVQRVYTGAMSAGIALTPEQAIAAFRTGEVGKQRFKTKDGKTTSVDVLRFNGRIIPMSDSPGFGDTSAATTTPGAASATKTAPQKKDGPAPAEGPGLLARMAESPVVKRISNLGTDYTSEAGKATLVKRVSEAGQGGSPLSEVEALRAKQAGLI